MMTSSVLGGSLLLSFTWGGLKSHSELLNGLIMCTLDVPVLDLAQSFKVNRKSDYITTGSTLYVLCLGERGPFSLFLL